MQFFLAVFPILLFAVSGVTSQQDPCNIIVYELPRACSCRLKELFCSQLIDSDIYDLTRAIQGRELKFANIILGLGNLTSLPSEAFRNVDTHTLSLGYGVFESNSSYDVEFFDLFPSLEILNINNVGIVEGNWRYFLPEGKHNLRTFAITGNGFSELWEGFPWTIGPNIEELLLIGTSVTELSSRTLHCPRCNSVEIINGELTRLNPYTFENCQNLRYLYLQNNNLHGLPSYAFSGRSLNITYIYLGGNHLTSLAPESFYGLSSHTTIDLQGQDRFFCDCYTWLDQYQVHYPTCILRGVRHMDLFDYMQTYCYGFTTESLTYLSTKDRWQTSPRPWRTTPDRWQTDDHTDRPLRNETDWPRNETDWSTKERWQTSPRPWDTTQTKTPTREDVTTVQPNRNSSDKKQVIVIVNEINVKVN